MSAPHKPRSGSLAFYPRKKAKRETPIFRTFPAVEGGTKVLNFLGYKAGMIHGIGRNEHQKSVSFGQMIYIPCTIIECPPIKIIGVRVYGKGLVYGSAVLGEATLDKAGKHIRRKIRNFKQKSKKREAKEESKEAKYTTIDMLEKLLGKATDVKLLAESQPSMADFGRKIPDVFEIGMNGNVNEKFAFAKDKFGQEIRVADVFQEKQFIDVKAVDKGKGMQGVVKRFGVKTQRSKAKTRRIVGSIGPWKPRTVMWTVARPGQMGYQTRTELNKRIMRISSDTSKINVPEGYKLYGEVKNDYIVVAGSVPGPAKRAIGLRFSVRKNVNDSFNVADLVFIGTRAKDKKLEGIQVD